MEGSDSRVGALESALAEVERLREENAQLRRTRATLEPSDARPIPYQRIVANLAEGVVLQGADGRILMCNAAAERILGLSAAQLAERTSLDPRWRSVREDGTPFPGEDHPTMVSLRTGQPQRDVIMGVHKPSGELTWIAVHSQPLFEREDDPKPHAVVASFTDITAHKRSEERARQSEQRLQLALSSARMGTWEWHIESGRVVWSAEVAEILGRDRSATPLHIDAYLEQIHPDDREEVQQHLQRAVEGELGNDMVTVEHRVVASDGSLRWIEGVGRVSRDEGGAPVLVAGTVRDISSRKSLELQLLQSQRMETVGRLAGGIAHDFNNLLTVIMGSADALAEQARLSGDARRHVEAILQASDNATSLTRQLLTFAKRRVFDLAEVDLREVVQQTERLLARILSEDIELHTVVPPHPVFIRAGRAQIEQVLMNLAVNAREAMPDGGSLHIELTEANVRPEELPGLAPGAYALLRVTDSGGGIDEALLPHVFEPFFTTKSQGTGLGLSTCYGIVTHLGGRMQVQVSAPGHTTFALHLPLSVASTRPEAGPLPQPQQPQVTGRILVVEDNDLVREVTAEGLREHGHEVEEEADARDALRLLHQDGRGFDLLLTDVVMPRMSGYELATQAREMFPGLKVLFVSGYSADTGGTGMLDAPRLEKPFTMAELAQAVCEQLASSSGPERPSSAE